MILHKLIINYIGFTTRHIVHNPDCILYVENLFDVSYVRGH